MFKKITFGDSITHCKCLHYKTIYLYTCLFCTGNFTSCFLVKTWKLWPYCCCLEPATQTRKWQRSSASDQIGQKIALVKATVSHRNLPEFWHLLVWYMTSFRVCWCNLTSFNLIWRWVNHPVSDRGQQPQIMVSVQMGQNIACVR